MSNTGPKVFIGCFFLFFLLVFAGLATNLYRSYQSESARTERLKTTQGTVLKWEEKWFNNGEDQFPYAQCTVVFRTESGEELERPLMTIFDKPEVDLDQTLSIVYDPENPSFVRTADEPDQWPQTQYYLRGTILCFITLVIMALVPKIASAGSKR